MTSLKSLVVISAALFVVFFFNVLLGAFAGNAFLSDVGEALVLFAATLVFVAAMLAAEKRANNQ
jgi:hypothetical protein